MRSLLPLVVLAPFAAAQEPSAARPEVARVEVEAGRAVVRTSLGVSTTLRREEVRKVAGPAHVEVAAGAHVRFSWIGRVSLEVYGPAALQWDVLPEREAAPRAMDTFSTRSLEVQLFDVAWADFEVRRGEHVLRLPGDWRVDCAAGAWHVRGLPSGPLELHHHAGRAARLTWLGDADAARPPLAVYPGSSIRLDRLHPDGDAVADESRQAWDDSSWPWRETADRPADRAERERLAAETDRMPGFPTRDPSAEGPRASVKGAPDPDEMRVVVSSMGGDTPDGNTAAERGPAAGRRRNAPQRPAAETEPRRGGTPVPIEIAPARRDRERSSPPVPRDGPAPAPRVPADDYRPEDWRDVPRERLERVGQVLVEETPGTEVRVFPSGRFKVLVDPNDERGSWAFSPTQDFHLGAGAVLMFDDAGEVVLRFGAIRELSPPAARAGDPRR